MIDLLVEAKSESSGEIKNSSEKKITKTTKGWTTERIVEGLSDIKKRSVR